jgi:hypothetical protein
MYLAIISSLKNTNCVVSSTALVPLRTCSHQELIVARCVDGSPVSKMQRIAVIQRTLRRIFHPGNDCTGRTCRFDSGFRLDSGQDCSKNIVNIWRRVACADARVDASHSYALTVSAYLFVCLECHPDASVAQISGLLLELR